MEKKMVVDTMFGIVQYTDVVNELVAGYFDEDGNYRPHFGLFNAMTVFCNNCVKESRFDEEFHGNVEVYADIEKIINDEEFIEAFNAAIVVERICLDFANAFRDALDIVNTNKSPINQVILKLKKLMNGFEESANKLNTPENIEMLAKLKSILDSGEFNIDKFIESYGDSKMFQQLLESKEKDKKYVNGRN